MSHATPHRTLAVVLSLYPRRYRDRFGDELAACFDEAQNESPAAARRLVFDLVRALPGTQADHFRLHLRPQLQRSLGKLQEASMFDSLLRDTRLAARRLLSSPLMTLLAAATLALGIGGTTAIFSLINDVLLNPLSAPNSEQLVQVHERSLDGDQSFLSYDTFRDYREQSESLMDLAAIRPQSVSVNSADAPPERIRGLFVSASFFTTLGEFPALGRAIEPGEDVPGGPRTAVLSHGFWQRRFGGERTVLGRTLKLNNEQHTIVGVMPPGFQFPIDTTEAWISLHTAPDNLDREDRSFFVIGRLAPGFSLEESREELAVLASGLAEAYPKTQNNITASAMGLVESMTETRTQDLFTILVAAVSMVLLIGTANVANLQLAQATGRAKEMAIRTAVGAQSKSLISQTMIESLLLALLGGLLGIGVAYGGIQLLFSFGLGAVANRYAVSPDPVVLAFAFAISLLTGLLFGMVPARQAMKVNLVEGLQEGGRGNGPGRKGQRLRAGLVVAQVALAVMLVISAGLLMRSFANLKVVDVGFDKEQLLTLQFRIPANKYETPQQVVNFFDGMLEAVAAVPGVQGVASALGMPFTGDEGRVPLLADGVEPGQDVQVPLIRANVVSENYFEHMGIPLLRGRSFNRSDHATGMPVAVISEQAAAKVWPDADAYVGKVFRIRDDERNFTVIGVVGDIYNRGLRGDVDPLLYISYRQEPAHFATIAARVTGDPHSHTEAIRQAIWRIDPDQPLWEIMTQEERIEGWTGSARLMASLLGIFACIALSLAAIGIGGVLAYSVTMRRRELGIRLSLGASRVRIVNMILGQGLLLVAIGLTLGVLGALGLSQSLSRWLFGVEAFDATIFLASPLLLTAVALLATLGPAWRAAVMDPVRTLREE